MSLTNFKNADLTINNINTTYIPKQYASEGDYLGRTLTVQITDDGLIGRIDGAQLVLHWKNMASGLSDDSAFTLIDAENAIFRIEYPTNMLTPGTVKANILVIYQGKTTVSREFEITVANVAGQSTGVLAKAEFSALVAVLSEANTWETRLATDKAIVNRQINDLTAQLAEIDAQKATKDELNALGQLKLDGTYDTLTALQIAFPSGATGLYLVIADGFTYRWNGSVWVQAVKFQSTGIAKNSVTVENVDFINKTILSVSRNVWNSANQKIYTEGYNFTTTFSAHATYVVYAIPIEDSWRGNKYRLNIDARQIIAVQNLATNVTSNDYGSTSPTGTDYFTAVQKGTSFIVPTNATYKYLYFSFYLSGIVNTIMSVPYIYMYAETDSSTPEEYYAQSYVYTLEKNIAINENNIPKQYFLNPLFGKKIGLTGDSVCYGHMLGALYVNPPINYGQLVATNNNMTISNTARNGWTVATGVYESSISTELVQLIESDCDFIILEGGYNDFRKDVPLGGLTGNQVYSGTLDTNTFYGALETELRYLFTNFKDKKKGYIITHKVAICDTPNTLGLKFSDYETAILNACSKYGVSVLNLFRTAGVTLLLDDNTVGLYTQTNQGQIHPNKLGYEKFYVPKIEAWLRTL